MQMSLRRMVRPAVGRPERVLATDSPKVARMLTFPIDIHILRAAMAPTVHVVDQSHAVNKPDELPGTIGVQHQKILSIPRRRILLPPPAAEPAILLHRLLGVPMPVHLQIDVIALSSRFELDSGRLGKRHLEVAVVATVFLDR